MAIAAPALAGSGSDAADAPRNATAGTAALRFITCGSVDDGKSTLIGRLLYDSKLLHADQIAALERDSRGSGSATGGLDFALLVDGLTAEREQGITIDVAYRFFATDRRAFIVADTPGHAQYTRNMVTGASTADLAVILIDASKGVLEQTRRHSFLVNLLGIRRIVLAVNKMDLVGYDAARFDAIVADYRAFAATAGIEDFVAIPLSGLRGENVVARADTMPWYQGPSLLEHLETVPVAARRAGTAFAMPVQWVNRPDARFRGYAGRIAGGVVRPGDEVVVLPAGSRARIARIVAFGGDLAQAVAGQSVTLTFDRDVDCARGDVIAAADAPPPLADRIAADLVWMVDAPSLDGRPYWLKIGTQTVAATIERVAHVIDIATLDEQAGRPLSLNDIGRAIVRLDRAVPVARYADDRALGRFLLIDRITNDTVAAGMVAELVASDRPRVRDADQRIFWLTAPRGAERTARAAAARDRLGALGEPSAVIDGAALRAGLSADLARDPAGRAEHVRRAREVARLLAGAGVNVVVAIEAEAADAFPGRPIEAIEHEGSDQWVI